MCAVFPSPHLEEELKRRIQITAMSPGSRFTSCESEEVLVHKRQKLAGEGTEDK